MKDFSAIVQAVVIGVSIIRVSDILVGTVNDFFTIVKTVVIGIEHRGIGVVGGTVPNESVHRLGEIFKTVGICVSIGRVGEGFVVFCRVGKTVAICIVNSWVGTH